MKKHIEKLMVYNVLKYAVTFLAPTITLAYTSRILHPEGIGIVNNTKAIGLYFVNFAMFGCSTYGIRRVASVNNDKSKLKSVSSELFVMNIFTTLCAVFLYSIFVFVFKGTGNFDDRLLIMNFAFVILGGLQLDWFFYGTEEVEYIALRSFVIGVLGIIGTYLFVKNENDRAIYYLMIIFSTYGYSFINIIRFLKQNHVNFRYVCWGDVFFHLKSSAIFLVIVALMDINFSIDINAVSFLLGDRDAGLYTVSYKIIHAIILVINSGIGVVMVSRASRNFSNESSEVYINSVIKSFNIVSMLAIPSAVGSVMISNFAVIVLGGNDFAESSMIMAILSVTIILACLSGVIKNTILLPQGHDNSILFIGIIGLIINVIGDIFFAKMVGLVGIALCTILSETVMLILYIFSSRRLIQLKIMISNLPQYFFASIVIIPIGLFFCKLNIEPLKSCIFIILVSIAAYFSILSCIGNGTVISIAKIIRHKFKERDAI